jgi:hypothetical protein
MSNLQVDFIIELWDTFKDYVPEKSKNDAASHFVDFLVGHDVSKGTLEDLMGNDPFLDRAIDFVLEEADEDIDNDDEDFDYDDEDY